MNTTITAMMSMLSMSMSCGASPNAKVRYGATTPWEIKGRHTQQTSSSAEIKPMAAHSLLWTPASWFSAFWETPESLPSHLAQ